MATVRRHTSAKSLIVGGANKMILHIYATCLLCSTMRKFLLVLKVAWGFAHILIHTMMEIKEQI